LSRVKRLFNLARRAFKPGARVVTFDGCFVTEQPPLARFIASRDRSQYVREAAEYAKLAAQAFLQVKELSVGCFADSLFERDFAVCQRGAFPSG
jgi:hypothetical protein